MGTPHEGWKMYENNDYVCCQHCGKRIYHEDIENEKRIEIFDPETGEGVNVLHIHNDCVEEFNKQVINKMFEPEFDVDETREHSLPF